MNGAFDTFLGLPAQDQRDVASPALEWVQASRVNEDLKHALSA